VMKRGSTGYFHVAEGEGADKMSDLGGSGYIVEFFLYINN